MAAGNRYGRLAGDLSEEAAIAEGESPFNYSVPVHDREWLQGRRAIESFYIREVERDKIVVAGSALDRAPARRSSCSRLTKAPPSPSLRSSNC